MTTQLALFDYAALDGDTRVYVQQRADEIKGLMKRAARDIIDIGTRLIEVKTRLGHGKFEAWLTAEFDWALQTARNFMRVATHFESTKFVDLLAPSALYLLSAPSTPEAAIVEATERAEAGETITHKAAQEIVERHRTTETHESNITTPAWQDEPAPEPPSIAANPMAVHFSSESPEWYTPEHIVQRVYQAMDGIDLDPCSDPGPIHVIPAVEHFTEVDDGLAQQWFGRVYMNPPYGSEIEAWVEKLCEEYEAGRVMEAIALLPARPDTAWFQHLFAYPICFVKGRLRFSESANSAPFPSVLVFLGEDDSEFRYAFQTIGPIVPPAYPLVDEEAAV